MFIDDLKNSFAERLVSCRSAYTIISKLKWWALAKACSSHTSLNTKLNHLWQLL